MVGFGVQFTIPMGTNRGQGEKLAGFSNDKKALISEPGINTIPGVFGDWTGIYISSWAGGGIIHPYPTLAAGSQTHGQK